MPRRPHCVALDELSDLLAAFDFSRPIQTVQLLHRGEQADALPHLTIATDGALWTGSDWNDPVADPHTFTIQVVGDFMGGRDRLTGQQVESLVGATACLLLRFDLPPDRLHFHGPLTAIDSRALLAELGRTREALVAVQRQQGVAAGPEGRAIRGRAREILEAWRQEGQPIDSGHASVGPDEPAATVVTGPSPAVVVPVLAPVLALRPTAASVSGAPGRRRALCIGIDRYPTMPLAGAEADARTWADTLAGLGFSCDLLLNEQADRQSILAGIENLIAGSRKGDVLVLQFAGHGTELADLDDDEAGVGTNGAKDEALCPVDIAEGRFVIDDDIRGVVSALPEGVSLTSFIDCCHSGTMTRMMLPARPVHAGAGRRARFLRATPQMHEAHRQFRAASGRPPSAARRDPPAQRDVLFSACRDSEVAYETGGHGEFTVRATAILKRGIQGMSNEAFERQVVQAFGDPRQQNPELHCRRSARALGLLQPLSARELSAPFAF